MAIEHILINIYKVFLTFFFLIVFSTSSYAFHYKNLELKITGTIAEMYDDNLTFEKDDKKEDVITTLGLGLMTKIDGKRRSLDLNGRVNYRFNSKYNDIKNNSENVAVNFNNTFSEYSKLGLHYTFNHSHTPETFEEELDRISGRRETYRHNANSNYLVNVSKRFSINAIYSYSMTQFSRENRNDTSNNRVGLNTHYMAGSSTRLSLSYYYSRNSVNNEINQSNLGLRYDITDRTYFEGSVGWDISSAGDKKTDNFNTYISLTNQIEENLGASISYSQSKRFSNEDGDVYRNWQVMGSFSRQISSRSNGYLSGFYGENTSIISDLTTTLLGINVSYAYEISDNINTSLLYSYADLGANNEDIGYVRNTISIKLSSSF